jgi:hypothetical protein
MVPLDAVLQVLQEYHPDVRLSSRDGEYERLCLVHDGQWAPGSLYVGRGSEIAVDQPEECTVVSIGEPVVDCTEAVVLPDECDLHEVFNRLQALFSALAEYELHLMRVSHTGSYQDMIDFSHRFLSNPLLLVDNSHDVLALAPDEEIPEVPEWEYVRHKRRVPAGTVRAVKEAGYLSLDTSQDLMVHSSAGFPFSFVMSNLYVDATFTGRVVVLGALKPFSPFDVAVVKMLTRAIELKMSNDETLRHTRGKGPIHKLFHDLVHGARLDDGVIFDRLQYLPAWTKGCFRVLLVPLGPVDDPAFNYYVGSLERKTDSRSIRCENSLVTVLHYRNKDDLSALKDTLRTFLSRYALTGGLSGEFVHLSELHDYYEQAASSLQLGGEENPFHIYDDLALTQILAFCPKEKTRLVCHPALLRLKQFDEKNRLRLCETLRAFLENERSLVRTARALGIHRSTLIYRIDKISTILDVDLNDPDTRLHLLLSQRLLDC